MFCISVSYKSAELSLREKLAFQPSQYHQIAEKLISGGNISQLVLLCTCNRTEVYFCGDNDCCSLVILTLSEFAAIPPDQLSKHLYFYYDNKAIKHLFQVTSGIDSMVLGEDEILGQAKTAYHYALKNGFTGYELNMIFQAAFACAKKIKTDTALSKTSVSVATIASNHAAKFGKNILVIGAGGKVGISVLKNLASDKRTSVKATLRHHRDRLRIFENADIEIVDYKNRYDYINWADCVISATASPHYTVTAFDLKNILTEKKIRLFIDLAVPPDIDRQIKSIDNTYLMNIDDIEGLAEENKKLKLSSVSQAEQIIEEEMETLKKDLLFHQFLPRLEELKGISAESLVYKIKSAVSANAFSEFLAALR